jgi:hypothetical protein
MIKLRTTDDHSWSWELKENAGEPACCFDSEKMML